MDVSDIFPEAKRWTNSRAENHRTLLAVLQAVSSVIGEQGVKPSPTSYFAALMTSLEATSNQDEHDHSHDMDEDDDEEKDISNEDEKAKSATLTLLSSVIPKVPGAVIKAKIGDITQVFLRVYQRYINSKSQALFKAFISCICSIFEGQRDPAVWTLRESMQLYQIILAYTLEKRAKIRKGAIAGISSILVSAPNENIKNKFGTTTSTFCLQALQPSNNNNNNNAKSSDSNTLHMLGSLKTMLPSLPFSAISSIVEAIFSLPTLTQPLVTLLAMNTFESLMGSQNGTALTSDFISKMITSFFQLQPNVSDVNLTVAFTHMMTKGFIKLHTVDASTCGKKLPKLFSLLLPNFASENFEISNATTQSLKSGITQCIDQSMIQAALTAVQSGVDNRANPTPLEKIISTLEGGLRFPYKRNWTRVLEIYTVLFEHLGGASYPLLVSILKSLGELYGTADLHTPELSSLLLNVLGTAISSMGPEKFLSVLPLNIENEEAGLRAWLLPLLADHIKNAELKYFATYFEPLATSVKKRGEEAVNDSKRSVEAKNLEIIYYQIWDLWPSFCNYPTDVNESFKFVAKSLGTIIQDEPQLRKVACQGLSHLIDINKRSVDAEADDEDFEMEHSHVMSRRSKNNIPTDKAKKNIAAMAAFSKNFLPCLFNVFGSATQPDEKAYLLRTIEHYISITDSKTLNPFFKNVVSKLLAATTANSEEKENGKQENSKKKKEETPEEIENLRTRTYLTELALSFVKHLDLENVKFLFKVIKPQLQDKNSAVQKKSFKILESICMNHEQFVKDKLDDIKKILTDTLLTCNAAAKNSRLRCLKHVIVLLSGQQLTMIVGDVILCSKEVNSKTRDAAFNVLITLANSMSAKEGGITEFFHMLVAGLAGTTPHMTSAAVIALSRLLYEFHSQLEDDFLSHLLSPITVLLGTGNREIIKASLGFVKVALVALKPELCEAHLPTLIGALSSMSNDNKHHFKMKIRRIFEKLVRRFDYDRILSYVSEQDHKLLNHIRKTEKRKDKQKAKNQNGEQDASGNGMQIDKKKGEAKDKKAGLTFEDALAESDSEEDSDQELMPKKKPQGEKKGKSWIVEDSDEPMDFLDAKSIKNVVSSDPNQKKRKSNLASKFEADESGKFLISDKKDKKKNNERSEYEAMIMEQEDQLDKKAGKRKRLANKDSDDEANADDNKKENDDDEENGKGRRKTVQAKRSRKDESHGKQTYQSKKGSGDVKKDGKVEPYAYLPLDPKLLNRRTNKKAAGQFKNIVAAAKKGSQVKVKKGRTHK